MPLAFALLPTTATLAQNADIDTNNYTSGAEFRDPLQSRFVQMAFGQSPAKKTTASQRVIWEIRLNPQFGFNDSTRYYYSAGRGSAFNYRSLAYHASEYSAPNSWSDDHISYDSVKYLDQTLESTRGYNAANKLTTHEESNKLRILAYNSSNLLSETTELAKLATLDSVRHRIFRYNNSGQIVFDSMFLKPPGTTVWGIEETIAYVYDPSGRLSGAHFKRTFANEQQLHEVLYAGNSTLPQTYIARDLNHATSTFENAYKIEFGYQNGTIIHVRTSMWDGVTQSWIISNEQHHHQNAAGLTDSVMIFTNGSADQYLLITYNNYNNPTSKTRFKVGNPSYLSKIIWRYEEISNTAVLTETKAQLKIYPNPATEGLHLAADRNGTYQIYSKAGQLVQSGRVQRGAAIPIHALVPGTYVLQVQDATGGNFRTSFVRQ